MQDGQSEDSGDFLDVLRRFPQQAETLSHRMDDIETDMQYIKGSLQFSLEHLAQGAAKCRPTILSDRRQDFTAQNPARKPSSPQPVGRVETAHGK